METPIFKLIAEELIFCKEKIDIAIQTLHELDGYFPDKPDIAVRLAQEVIKYEDTHFIVEKLIKLQWMVTRGNFEEDK
ncbi:hypothetical protein [Nostoc sp. UHCC 0252]|uniref:hypothetical protein n=1 Tax=Nostoc sp. UHCC 0252 TaxID=3110241 RepID=UPI002B20A076|nr:hypothetical protein [Nostoc sp. UHCC 0252]MEA5603687.1 hypothetical protein [Nostoc sp. UHCC 0252]